MRKKVVCKLVGAAVALDIATILERFGWTRVSQTDTYVEMVGNTPPGTVLRLTSSGYVQWYVDGVLVRNVYFSSATPPSQYFAVGNQSGFYIVHTSYSTAQACGYALGVDGVKRFWCGSVSTTVTNWRSSPVTVYHLWDNPSEAPFKLLSGKYPVPHTVGSYVVPQSRTFLDGNVLCLRLAGVRLGGDQTAHVLPDLYYTAPHFRPGGYFGLVQLRSDAGVSTGFVMYDMVVDIGGFPW